MRTSQFLLTTLKENPADAEIVSHQLMLRTGMIRQVAAGIYDWLPLGLRVLRKVETVVREEMNRSGAQEVLLPAVQPAELWRESGRWDDYGPELLRFSDRHQREFCFGPTHEEVITALARTELKSYRQLPTNLYQIQTKFRDEIRPRFGVMRAREFIMKDAYSFDIDSNGMAESYAIMYEAYKRIFKRLGLEARAVQADSGAIGGNFSHEFHVMANSGEDSIAICKSVGYSANVETVDLPGLGASKLPASTTPMQEVATPDQHTIESLCAFLNIKPEQTIKTLIVEGSSDNLVAILLRGDHELNVVKTEKLDTVKTPLRMASPQSIQMAIGVAPGTIGPVGLELTMIADHSALLVSDFTCGANAPDTHLNNVNWGRDLPLPPSADLRKATTGDPCPGHPEHTIEVRRGIEVGHVFQLGTKYSDSMGATILDESGKSASIYMGCYGIGITRIVAAAIEQNHDKDGIVWPTPISPFDICIVPIGLSRSTAVAKAAEEIYTSLADIGLDVLLDDRNERPGVMFAEMDLIGIPHRLVISERGLQNGTVEYRNRASGKDTNYLLSDLTETLKTIRIL